MKKYILLLSLCFSFFSCRVNWVPPYNDGIVTQVQAVAKMSDKLLFQVQEAAEPDRAYAKYKDQYVDIQVELQDLLRKEQNRTKADELVKITNNIIEQFVKYKEVHRTKDTKISDGVLTLEREFLSDHFVILLAAEKSLK